MKLKFIITQLIIFSSNIVFSQCYLENQPFNIATSVKIVSFTHKVPETIENFKKYNHPSLPMKSYYEIDFEKLAEIKTLNLTQIAELADIAFSDQSGCVDHSEIVGDCSTIITGYAVLFFNEDGKVFDSISLFFECETFNCLFGFELGWLCSKKYELLKNYLIKIGFKI